MSILTEKRLDALKELVNIGVGKAAGILNEMLDSHIDLDVPSIISVKPNECENVLSALGDKTMASVQLDFHGSFAGTSMLVFPSDSAVKLVAALTNEEPGSIGLDAVMAGTLNEVGNIVINGVMGSIGNLLENPIDFSLPHYIEGKPSDLINVEKLSDDVMILLVQANFIVKNLQINGKIFLIFKLGSFGSLLTAIDEIYSD